MDRWGAVLAWRWSATRTDAARVYAAKREQGEIAAHVDEADFRDAYVRAEAPRGATHFFLAALASAILIPPLMAIFSSLWHEVWTLTGQWAPTAQGTMVHTFSMFLMMMAAMIAILAFTMRRYHSRTPPNLRQAIQQLNGPRP
ncbi:MAG: hypothetical protein AAF253_12535 [Pseudomonadota bacterium]